MMKNKNPAGSHKSLRNWMLFSGFILGAAAVILARTGNPPNMGICAACFVRDTAGGLGLFSKPAGLQYLRPEIPGFLLGSFVAAVLFREFRSRGGSSPLLRFIIGAFVTIGAMVFLGCPIRLIVRLGSGDHVTAWSGLLGLVAGVGIGCLCIRRGFSLGTGCEMKPFSALAGPLMGLGLLGFIFFLKYGNSGDLGGFIETKWHAPIFLSLLLGLLVGFFAQRSRYCTTGGFRDALLWRDFRLLNGYLVLLATIAVGNLLLDLLWPGDRKLFDWGASPLTHSIHLWNFLGLLLVGLGSTLVGGCPFRQLVATGQGNSDAALTVLGMMFGAAFCHNFGLIAAPASAVAAGGPTQPAKVAVLVGIALLFVIGMICTDRKRRRTADAGNL